jgi:hypothetical protein
MRLTLLVISLIISLKVACQPTYGKWTFGIGSEFSKSKINSTGGTSLLSSSHAGGLGFFCRRSFTLEINSELTVGFGFGFHRSNYKFKTEVAKDYVVDLNESRKVLLLELPVYYNKIVFLRPNFKIFAGAGTSFNKYHKQFYDATVGYDLDTAGYTLFSLSLRPNKTFIPNYYIVLTALSSIGLQFNVSLSLNGILRQPVFEGDYKFFDQSMNITGSGTIQEYFSCFGVSISYRKIVASP